MHAIGQSGKKTGPSSYHSGKPVIRNTLWTTLKKTKRNSIPEDQHGSLPYQNSMRNYRNFTMKQGKTIPRFGGLDIHGGWSPTNVDCEETEKENTTPNTKPRIQTNTRGSDNRECRGQGPPTSGHHKELTGEIGKIAHTSVNNVNTFSAVNMCDSYLSNECNDVNISRKYKDYVYRKMLVQEYLKK